MNCDPRTLLYDTLPGKDNGKVSWYAEPNYAFVQCTENGPKQVRGTFRHSSCRRVADSGTFSNDTCFNCSQIPNCKSFRKRILQRTGHYGTIPRGIQLNFQYMTAEESTEKLREMRKERDEKDSEIFFLKAENLRLKLRIRTAKEKLKEFSRRGDLKAISYKLEKAGEAGMFNDKQVLLDTLGCVANNLHVKGSQGKRYKTSVQQFFEVVLIWGGPRLATFVANNLFGPEVHSIYKWRQAKTYNFAQGIILENVKKIASIYSATKKSLGITTPVPVMLAEDETAIIGKIMYDEQSDTLQGFCGINTDPADHKCVEDFFVHIGDDDGAYDRLVSAFAQCKIANYARLILINPLISSLPKIPILIMPTCNKFSHEHVSSQWSRLAEMFKASLEPVLGPLIGNSSDGDSRRRKLMLQTAEEDIISEFRPIPEDLGFIFHATREASPDEPGGYKVRDLCDQDAIHNHKKCINPLDHATRILHLGNNYMAHMNHLKLVTELFELHHHGLTKNDILRKDRQNWASAQRLTFLRVQHCLQQIVDGIEEISRPPDPSVLGTLTYLRLVWYYVEIFFSPVASLVTRIKYAALVTHFLGIWRNFIVNTQGLNLKSHFITRECYQDLLLSTHFTVMLICYYRDNHANLECPLHLTGSEPCEVYFSANGQWVGNHHNYTFLEMRRNQRHMVRLAQIEADPNGPKFARAHVKQENIWSRQYNLAEEERANLKRYPANGEEVIAWKEGIQMAREMAVSVGMAPVDGDENSDGDDGDGDDGDEDDGDGDDGDGDDGDEDDGNGDDDDDIAQRNTRKGKSSLTEFLFS